MEKFEEFWTEIESIDKSITYSEDFKDLILKMLNFKPENRLNLTQVFDHQWTRGE